MLDNIIEILDNEVDLFIRVNALESLGYNKSDMYIITQDKENISMLRGYSEIMIKEEDHSTLDRFKSFLKGEDSVIDAFKRMGLNKEEVEDYYNEVKNGKFVFIVDANYESDYVLGKDGILVARDMIDNISAEIDSELIEDIEVKTREILPDSVKKDIGVPVGAEAEIGKPYPRDEMIPDDKINY